MVLLRAGVAPQLRLLQDAPGSSDTTCITVAPDLHPASRRRFPTPSHFRHSRLLPRHLLLRRHRRRRTFRRHHHLHRSHRHRHRLRRFHLRCQPRADRPPTPGIPPAPDRSAQAIPALSAAAPPATLPDDCPGLHTDQPPRLKTESSRLYSAQLAPTTNPGGQPSSISHVSPISQMYLGRVAKRVVLGMISWQARVFVSKKVVDKKRLCAPFRAFSTVRDGDDPRR